MSDQQVSDQQISSGNLLTGLPDSPCAEEIFETLLANPNVRIERIVSMGQASPTDFWFDEPQAEWVLLVQGLAQIKFEDEAKASVLHPGDYVFIAPHRRHRIQFTQACPPTVWLAVHFA